MVNANSVLGEDIFKTDDWTVIGEYVYDIEGGRHQAFYAPNRDLEILGVKIRAGERVQVEQSLKYSPDETRKLWQTSGLEEVEKWAASRDDYGKSSIIPRFSSFVHELATIVGNPARLTTYIVGVGVIEDKRLECRSGDCMQVSQRLGRQALR